MKYNNIQSNFSAGEISPQLSANVQLDVYKSGLKTLRNAIPLPHGPVKRRNGTFFVGGIKTPTQKALLIPFVYSTTVSFLLIVNGGSIEFVKYQQFIMNGASRVTVTVPYVEADLTELRYAQIGRALFLIHPKYPPKQLIRVSDTSWTFTDVAFTHSAVTDYSFENYYIKFKLLGGNTKFIINDGFTIAATTGTVTAARNGTPGNANTGNGTVAAVSFQNSAPTETWTVLCTYADSDRQEWSVTGGTSGKITNTWFGTNYPSSVAIYNQRLFLAGTTLDPQAIWGSKIGDYTNFTRGSRDDDAVKHTIAGQTNNKIIHLESARQLIALSYGGEFAISGSGVSGITPSAAAVVEQTRHGAENVKPIRIGQEVLFTQRGGRIVRAISYSVTEDVNVAPDISILAEHITAPRVTDCCFSQSPNYTAWYTRDDGALLSLTHMRDFKITAWGKHDTDGMFETVCSIPDSGHDVVYTVVKRTINGSTVRYIEMIDTLFNSQTDCATYGYEGTAKTTWTSLGHLEGKLVHVVADGNAVTTETVTGGSITLPFAAYSVQIGLPYTSEVELLHPDVPMKDGSSQGRRTAISDITVRVHETIGLKINGTQMHALYFGLDNYGEPPTPITGDMSFKNLGISTINNVKITQELPFSFALLGVIFMVNVNE